MAAEEAKPMGPTRRVVAHLDLDCFYCQVEMARLGIPKDQPFAVQQWGGLLAVNYAARDCGVRRLGDDPKSAAQKVAAQGKTMKFCHVKLLPFRGASAAHLRYLDSLTQARSATTVPVRTDGTVTLEPYREAGERIMQTILASSSLGQGGVISKTSVDEFFVDLTSLVATQTAEPETLQATATHIWNGLEAEYDYPGFPSSSSSSLSSSSSSSSSSSYSPISEDFLRAAGLVADARRVVREELGFEISAGIARNKMLSKLASSRHKPNKQTIVPDCAVPSILREVKLTSIGGLGGKVGKRVLNSLNDYVRKLHGTSAAAVESAASVQPFSRDQLCRIFHDSDLGRLVYDRARGIDNAPITASHVTQSINTFKNVSGACNSEEQLQEWLGFLSTQLAGRAWRDFQNNQRRPQKISFMRCFAPNAQRSSATSSRRRGAPLSVMSKSGKFPTGTFLSSGDDPSVIVEKLEKAILAQAVKLLESLKKEGKSVVPCFRVGLSLSDLETIKEGSASILSHFSSADNATGGTLTSAAFVEQVGLSVRMGEAKEEVPRVMRCDLCGLTFLNVDRWQQHLDEHYAMELEASFRQEDPQKRTKPGKITAFFSAPSKKKARF